MHSHAHPVRTLAGKLIRFGAPLLLVLWLAEAWVPLEWTTFRCWEALRVDQDLLVQPGPFYANQQMSRIEVGDLAPHTADAVPKKVVWQTDRVHEDLRH